MGKKRSKLAIDISFFQWIRTGAIFGLNKLPWRKDRKKCGFNWQAAINVFSTNRISQNLRPSNVRVRQPNNGCVHAYFPLFSLSPFSILTRRSSCCLESFLARNNPLSASASKMVAEQVALPNTPVLQPNYMVVLSCFIHSVISISWSWQIRIQMT